MEKTTILLKAISYAARIHKNQFRKDNETPYVSHPFRVYMILRQVFGVTNENVLVAAILHDAIEDTTSDFDDLESAFGFEIASWVGLLSKDKRMPEEKRELAYRGQLRSAPPEVKLIKLADIYDNILDSESSTKANPTKTRNNAIKHLKNLKETNNAAVSKAITIVETLICQEKKGQNKGR